MPTYTCANGHQSTTSDYCSECGKKLGDGHQNPSSSAASGVSPSSATTERCPDCATPRANSTAAFCEVCRYNFATGQPWVPGAPSSLVAPGGTVPTTSAPSPHVPTEAATSASVPSNNSPAVSTSPTESLRRWEAVVSVDSSLYVDPDPAVPCPVDSPERVFPLDFAENLIGRRSERRAIYPEIDMSTDHGVSSRHAVIYRESDGRLTVLDVGSTNGTQVNGADLAPGIRFPLSDGDQITLGCWTRITIRAVARGTAQP